MRILVTGAGGQLATELFNLKTSLALLNFSRAELDICNIDSVSKILKQQKPDWVINAAAYTAVDRAETEPEAAFAVNFMGVENLAKVCSDLNVPLLHISTDYVFSGEKHQPYTEDDSCEPNNVYGKSKLAGELVLKEILPQHIILRTSWVYGQYGKNFMKTMLRLAQEKKELAIIADQQGSPTATPDLAYAILKIIQADKQYWGTYHCTNQESTTWFEFAKAIFKYQTVLPSAPELKAITTSEYITVARRPMYSVLDCAKLKKNYGIMLQPWDMALKSVLKNYEKI